MVMMVTSDGGVGVRRWGDEGGDNDGSVVMVELGYGDDGNEMEVEMKVVVWWRDGGGCRRSLAGIWPGMREAPEMRERGKG
ncbi:hypothetical protein Tco_0192820, partial [Tanacetum coccineum]